MSELIGMAIVALALFFASVRFTDMWYHERGGIKWIWFVSPASTWLWVARTSLVLAIVLILLIPLFAAKTVIGIAAGGLFVIHMLALGLIR